MLGQPVVCRSVGGFVEARPRPPQVVRQHYSLRNLLHRDAPTPALPQQLQLGLLLGQAKVPLQNTLGSPKELARLPLAGQLRDFRVQPSALDFRADEVADRRHQLDGLGRVLVREAVLQVHDFD